MHQIRLRGPWELTPLARVVVTSTGQQEVAKDLPAGGRIQMPSDGRELLGDDFTGRARLTRRFNQPTNLDPRERVLLVLASLDERGVVRLNGEQLSVAADSATARRHDITRQLKLHNVLEIDLPYPGVPLGDVHLEITP